MSDSDHIEVLKNKGFISFIKKLNIVTPSGITEEKFLSILEKNTVHIVYCATITDSTINSLFSVILGDIERYFISYRKKTVELSFSENELREIVKKSIMNSSDCIEDVENHVDTAISEKKLQLHLEIEAEMENKIETTIVNTLVGIKNTFENRNRRPPRYNCADIYKTDYVAMYRNKTIKDLYKSCNPIPLLR